MLQFSPAAPAAPLPHRQQRCRPHLPHHPAAPSHQRTRRQAAPRLYPSCACSKRRARASGGLSGWHDISPRCGRVGQRQIRAHFRCPAHLPCQRWRVRIRRRCRSHARVAAQRPAAPEPPPATAAPLQAGGERGGGVQPGRRLCLATCDCDAGLPCQSTVPCCMITSQKEGCTRAPLSLSFLGLPRCCPPAHVWRRLATGQGRVPPAAY